MDQYVKLSHWLPIITICPVTKLPDLLYISLTFKEEFVELYQFRKQLKIFNFTETYMELVANDLERMFPNAVEIEVKLLTGRHIVRLVK